MIENITREWLEDGGIAAVLEMPEDFPGGSFVRIEKTGGGYMAPGVRSAVLALQSYGDSLYEAAALNRHVITRMEQMAERNDICRCRLNSDYNFPDMENKRHRYQAVFDILYYEED